MSEFDLEEDMRLEMKPMCHPESFLRIFRDYGSILVHCAECDEIVAEFIIRIDASEFAESLN